MTAAAMKRQPAIGNQQDGKPQAEQPETPSAPKRRGRKKKTDQLPQGAYTANSSSNGKPPLPAVDLTANVPQGDHWQEVKRWVVFSDLHVSPKTEEVACEVLRRVCKEAAARDAGILFLGELSVNCQPPPRDVWILAGLPGRHIMQSLYIALAGLSLERALNGASIC